MRRLLGRLWRLLGRRGCALLFFAELDLVMGLSLLMPSEITPPGASLRFALAVLPGSVWGVLWLTSGLLCLAGAVSRTDVAAWVAVMSIKVMWGTVYLCGWWIAGVDRGWLGAAVWLSLAALVAVLAGWPEPSGGREPLWTRRPRQR